MIKEVSETFEKLNELHKKKNEDYTGETGNPFFNFDVAADISRLFTDNEHKTYAVMVGIKLGRIAALLSSSKSPNHESIEDSFDDMIVYLAIWKAHTQRETYRIIESKIIGG